MQNLVLNQETISHVSISLHGNSVLEIQRVSTTAKVFNTPTPQDCLSNPFVTYAS